MGQGLARVGQVTRGMLAQVRVEKDEFNSSLTHGLDRLQVGRARVQVERAQVRVGYGAGGHGLGQISMGGLATGWVLGVACDPSLTRTDGPSQVWGRAGSCRLDH